MNQSLLFARSGDGLSRDARTRPLHTWRRPRKSAMDSRWFLTCRTGIYPLFLPLSLDITLYLPHSLSPWSFVKSALNKSPDHQTIAPEWTASHRTASHQHRSLSLLQTAYSPLLLGLLLTLSYPHHRLHSRHATPLLSTACGTIKSQLSYQRIWVSYPCVRIVFSTFFIKVVGV